MNWNNGMEQNKVVRNAVDCCGVGAVMSGGEIVVVVSDAEAALFILCDCVDCCKLKNDVNTQFLYLVVTSIVAAAVVKERLRQKLIPDVILTASAGERR